MAEVFGDRFGSSGAGSTFGTTSSAGLSFLDTFGGAPSSAGSTDAGGSATWSRIVLLLVVLLAVVALALSSWVFAKPQPAPNVVSVAELNPKSILTIDGSTAITGSLSAGQSSSITTLAVGGATVITSTSPTVPTTTLVVNGDAAFNDTLTVTTVDVTQDLTVDGVAKFSSVSTTGLTVTDAADIDGTLTVTGAITAVGGISGAGTNALSVSAATFSGGIIATTGIIVTGPTGQDAVALTTPSIGATGGTNGTLNVMSNLNMAQGTLITASTMVVGGGTGTAGAALTVNSNVDVTGSVICDEIVLFGQSGATGITLSGPTGATGSASVMTVSGGALSVLGGFSTPTGAPASSFGSQVTINGPLVCTGATGSSGCVSRIGYGLGVTGGITADYVSAPYYTAGASVGGPYIWVGTTSQGGGGSTGSGLAITQDNGPVNIRGIELIASGATGSEGCDTGLMIGGSFKGGATGITIAGDLSIIASAGTTTGSLTVGGGFTCLSFYSSGTITWQMYGYTTPTTVNTSQGPQSPPTGGFTLTATWTRVYNVLTLMLQPFNVTLPALSQGTNYVQIAPITPSTGWSNLMTTNSVTEMSVVVNYYVPYLGAYTPGMVTIQAPQQMGIVYSAITMSTGTNQFISHNPAYGSFPVGYTSFNFAPATFTWLVPVPVS